MPQGADGPRLRPGWVKRFDDAVADCRAAMLLNPDEEDLLGKFVGTQMQACDWRDFETSAAALLTGIRAGTALVNPFALLAMPGTPADQLICARGMTARDFPPMEPLYRGEKYVHDRVRIAYVSGDFRKHALSYLMAGVFEHHDHSRFETFGVSIGRDDASAIRARVAGAFDRFIDAHGKSDTEIARQLRTAEIDIAIDLGGFTTGGRPRVFAMRPAPVQASYLGYPGTSGAPYIDYVLADATVIPASDRDPYSEEVVRLPDTYYPNDDKRLIAPLTPTRAAVGLPETGFVFCSFNNNYKITPAVFDIWMGLLAEVEGSVLWLLQSNAISPGNLRREAEGRGISASRLVFAPTLPVEEHLARHRLADLFLDTSPYNAHTTACDALWVGLPVLTCPGSTFPSRVAASLLHAVGLPELVTASFEDYRQLALTLAREPARLATIKAKLAANRDTTALFDTARLTRHLEAAYATMVERHRRGEAPAAFAVAPFG